MFLPRFFPSTSSRPQRSAVERSQRSHCQQDADDNYMSGAMTMIIIIGSSGTTAANVRHYRSHLIIVFKTFWPCRFTCTSEGHRDKRKLCGRMRAMRLTDVYELSYGGRLATILLFVDLFRMRVGPVFRCLQLNFSLCRYHGYL